MNFAKKLNNIYFEEHLWTSASGVLHSTSLMSSWLLYILSLCSFKVFLIWWKNIRKIGTKDLKLLVIQQNDIDDVLLVLLRGTLNKFRTYIHFQLQKQSPEGVLCWHRRVTVKFGKFLRVPFMQNASEWMVLQLKAFTRTCNFLTSFIDLKFFVYMNL